MIAFGLSEDQEMVQATVRKLAVEVLRPRQREIEKLRGIPEDLVARCDDLALYTIDVPDALGGMGLGLGSALVVHEELAFGDPAAAVALWSPHLAASALVELADE